MLFSNNESFILYNPKKMVVEFSVLAPTSFNANR